MQYEIINKNVISIRIFINRVMYGGSILRNNL